jgi:hypothetical protein
MRKPWPTEGAFVPKTNKLLSFTPRKVYILRIPQTIMTKKYLTQRG